MTQAGTLYKLNFPNGKSYIGIALRGRVQSIEHRLKNSAAKLGKPFSAERKEAMCKAWVGRRLKYGASANSVHGSTS